MREECDIVDGDRTGGLAKDRESLDRNVETATQGRAATPGTGRREGDAARRAPENHNTGNNTAGQQRTEEMTRMKLTNTKGKETVAKRRESGVTANYHMRKIIGGILGEEGKDRMYKERGAGRRKKGPAGLDKTKTEDKPAGLEGEENKDKPVGLDGDVTKDKPAELDGDEIDDVPEGLDVDVDEPARRDGNKTEDKPAGLDGDVTKDKPAGPDGNKIEDEPAGRDGDENEDVPKGLDGRP